VISQAPELYEQKNGITPFDAPVITADIRTASGDLGPDWSQKSSKSSRCPRWRTACEAGSDTAPARSGSSGRVGGGGLRGPSPGELAGHRVGAEGLFGGGPSQRRVGHTIRRRQQGRGVAVWRRPRLGRSRPATPGPACPPSRWLAPGRGGQSGPSAGLRPAPRRRSIAAIESATRCRRRGRSQVFPPPSGQAG
jgi:hypothetical protein